MLGVRSGTAELRQARTSCDYSRALPEALHQVSSCRKRGRQLLQVQIFPHPLQKDVLAWPGTSLASSSISLPLFSIRADRIHSSLGKSWHIRVDFSASYPYLYWIYARQCPWLAAHLHQHLNQIHLISTLLCRRQWFLVRWFLGLFKRPLSIGLFPR